MNGKYNGFLVCDNLISDIPIDKELVETKGKVISGILGSFNINEILETLRKK